MTRPLTWLIVAVATLCIVALATAADVVTRYPAPLVTGNLDAISTADVAALDSTSYATRTLISTADRKTLTVAVTFSTASATATVGIVRMKGNAVDGFTASRSVDWATFTADATFKVGGRYVSQSAAFDTANFPAAMPFVRTVSAGDVVVAWSVH